VAALLACASPSSPAGAQSAAERANRGLVEIVAAGADSTALEMVQDLSQVFDDGGTRRVLPVIGKGALQNVADLKLLRGVDIAVIQADVLDYARRERLYPGAMTYIAKLHDAEFHLLAREDIRQITDLAGKPVNFGAPGESAAVTGPAVFEKLRIKVEPTSYPSALALEKLRSGEIAAAAYVIGKPAKLFGGLQPGEGLHLLAIPFTSQIAESYVPARLSHDDYPDLVPAKQPVGTIAVGMAMMVANLIPGSERYRNVASFVDALFTQLGRLQEAGHHPKWREVDLAAELPGWSRFPAADAWLKRNLVASGPALSEQELRMVFSKFLDERSRSGGGRALSAQEKERLFDLFLEWRGSRRASQ
jgi:TRAP-type uncharacterized transport system substrate-binding protein